MYVTGIHFKKFMKHDKLFEGQIGKIIKGGWEVYRWGISKTCRMWVALQDLSRLEPLRRHASRRWVTLNIYAEPLMRMGGHPSRKWVTFQCLSRSEPLTRMDSDEPTQRASPSPIHEQIRTTDENGWTPIQAVSHLSSALADQSHWQDLVNTHPESELLSIP